MRIAYINSFYYPDEIGGAERSVKFLAEAMIEKGHQSLVICLGKEDSAENINGVDIRRIKPKNIYNPLEKHQSGTLKKLIWHSIDANNIANKSKIKKVLDEWKPDVLHTNNLSGLSISAWHAAKSHRNDMRIVHTLRDYYLLCPATSMFKNGQQCENRCIECKALSKPKEKSTELVDIVVGNSKYILDTHTQYGLFKKSKKKVIYNAYKPKSTKEPQQHNITKIGYIGRIAKTKGIEVLIGAIEHLRNQGSKKLELIIAGTGEPSYIEDLKRKIGGMPTTFLGQVPADEFYNQVDLVVVPSLWAEPLARVLFETMAHGLPLVSSATGGSPELVKNGETGYLYEPAHCSKSLADAIANYLHDNAGLNRTISMNQVSASKTFLPAHVAKKYEENYLE